MSNFEQGTFLNIYLIIYGVNNECIFPYSKSSFIDGRIPLNAFTTFQLLFKLFYKYFHLMNQFLLKLLKIYFLFIFIAAIQVNTSFFIFHTFMQKYINKYNQIANIQIKCTSQYLQLSTDMYKKLGPYVGKTLNGYYIDQYISAGNFASVYKCYPVRGSAVQPQYMAMKIYDNSQYEEYEEYIEFQIQTLKKIKNPYVIKCYDRFKHQFPENHMIIHCVVLEYCNGGTLKDFFEQNREKNNERMVRKFLKQILDGVRSIHQVNAMHRDLKGQNIMLSDGIIKIVDFGLGKGSQGGQLVGQTYAGSPHTMAPEVKKIKLNKGGTYDKNVDIYSIGVIAYQMLEGNFSKEYKKQLQFTSMQVSSQMLSFLKGCLQQNPTKRLKWQQIMQHPIYTDSGSSIIKFKNEDDFDFLLRSSNNNSDYLPIKESIRGTGQQQNQINKVSKKKFYDLNISKISEQSEPSMDNYPSFSKIQKQKNILPDIQSINSKGSQPSQLQPFKISTNQKPNNNLYPSIVSLKSHTNSNQSKNPSQLLNNEQSSIDKNSSISPSSGPKRSSLVEKPQNPFIDNYDNGSDIQMKESSQYKSSEIIKQLQEKQKFQQLYKKCNDERDRFIYSLDQTFCIGENFQIFEEIEDSQFAKFQFFSYKRVYLAIKKMLTKLNQQTNILNVDPNIWSKFCKTEYYKNLVEQLTEIVRQLRENAQESANELDSDPKLIKQRDPDDFYIDEEIFQKWYINNVKNTYVDLVDLFDTFSNDENEADLIKICSILLYNIENRNKIGYAYQIESTISKPVYRSIQHHKERANQFRHNTTFEFLYPKQ